jgi:hypothetical protein
VSVAATSAAAEDSDESECVARIERQHQQPTRSPHRVDRLARDLLPDDRRAAGLRVLRATDLRGAVRPASEHTPELIGSQRVLPVLPELRPLLPGGGLRRGSTIAVHSTSALLALLCAASGAGSWCAVVGLPTLNPVAAAETGIALDRLVLVPHPGTGWTTVVAALLDGVDIVVAAPPGPIAPVVANRLAARARSRGGVFMPAGNWIGADLAVEAVRGVWEGLGSGRGRLRCRQVTLRARGRGAAVVSREVTVWLPAARPTSTGSTIAAEPPVPVEDRTMVPLRKVG